MRDDEDPGLAELWPSLGPSGGCMLGIIAIGVLVLGGKLGGNLGFLTAMGLIAFVLWLNARR